MKNKPQSQFDQFLNDRLASDSDFRAAYERYVESVDVLTVDEAIEEHKKQAHQPPVKYGWQSVIIISLFVTWATAILYVLLFKNI